MSCREAVSAIIVAGILSFEEEDFLFVIDDDSIDGSK